MSFSLARTATTTLSTAALLTVSAAAQAQTRPFPTSGHYAQGFIPAAATAQAAQSSYDSWKSKYVKNDCGGTNLRIDNSQGATFSEGQGYGMVLAAYFGDKAEFDGLWAFAQKNMNSSHLMGWHVNCSGPTQGDGGVDSAADGDEDIGFGLVVAAAQWGGTYLDQAKSYLKTLKAIDFTTCSASGRTVATAGSWQGNQACTTSGGGSNTSYWTPAYYRVFATLTGDSFWEKTANDVVTLYGLSANAKTGLMPNEVDQNGAPVSGQSYDYNSCRIPWRAALDYLWYGTAGSKDAMTKLTAWVNSVGISKVVDGYKPDGTATGQYTGINGFVGGFAVGAMTDSQALADAFGSYFVKIDNDNGAYYGASLRTLYLLALSGNQWNPLEVLGGSDGGTLPPPMETGGTSGGGNGGAGATQSTGGRATAAGGTAGMRSTGGRTGMQGTSGRGGGGGGGGGNGVSGGGGDGNGVSGGGGHASGTGGGSAAVPGGGTRDGGSAGSESGASDKSSSGCGCRVGEGHPPAGAAGALALAAALGFVRRRRAKPRA